MATEAAPDVSGDANSGEVSDVDAVQESPEVEAKEEDSSNEEGSSKSQKAADLEKEVPKPYEPKTKKFKIKGKDVEVTYKTEEEELRDLQRGRYMSQEREEFQKEREQFDKEAAEVRATHKAVTELVMMLRDPEKAPEAYRLLGVSPEVPKAQLKAWLKQQDMTPEQRELEELRQFKADQAKHAEETKRQTEAKEMEALEQQEMETLGNRITSALKKMGIEPGSAEATPAVRRMAFKMEQALLRKEDYDVSDDIVAETFMDEVKSEHNRLYGTMSGQALYDLIGGDAGFKKLNDYKASQIKRPGTINSPGKKAEVPGKSKFKTLKEELAWWEQKAMDEAAGRSED